MAKKSRGGNSYKTQYKAYKVRGQWRKNKLAKLTKRAVENENDTHALEVFEKGSKEYGRSKPGNKGWFHPQETKLLRETGSDNPQVAKRAKIKLADLREVYADKRPSAARMKTAPVPQTDIAKQLLDIGLINAKRYKTFRSCLGRVFSR